MATFVFTIKTLFYKFTIKTFKVSDIHLLDECINFDLKLGNKRCSFIPLYRSPSQSQDDFTMFSHNTELTLDSLSKKK